MECNSNNRYHITAEGKHTKKYNAAQKTGQIDGQTYGQTDRMKLMHTQSLSRQGCCHNSALQRCAGTYEPSNRVTNEHDRENCLQENEGSHCGWMKGWMMLYAGTTSCKGCKTQRLLGSPVEWNAWNNITAHERNEVMMEGLKLQW